MTEPRAITVSPLILPRLVSTSSCMPSAKNASSFSALMFSNGRTATVFSDTGTACAAGEAETDAAGWTRLVDFVRYHPATAITQAAATAAATAILLTNAEAGVVNRHVCGKDNCNWLATAAID